MGFSPRHGTGTEPALPSGSGVCPQHGCTHHHGDDGKCRYDSSVGQKRCCGLQPDSRARAPGGPARPLTEAQTRLDQPLGRGGHCSGPCSSRPRKVPGLKVSRDLGSPVLPRAVSRRAPRSFHRIRGWEELLISEECFFKWICMHNIHCSW